MSQDYGVAEFDVVAHTEDRREAAAFASLLLFTALFFLRPWDHWPLLAAARPMLLCTALTIVLFLLSRPRIALLSVRPTGLLLVQFAVMCFSVIFSYWPSQSVAVATEFFKHIVLFVLYVNLLTSLDRLQKLAGVLVFCGAVHGCFAIVNYSGQGSERLEGMTTGYFRDPNDLALAMVMILPIAWCLGSLCESRWKRLAVFACALLLIGGIVATQSRGGMLALFGAVTIIVGTSSRERRMALGVGLVVVTALVIAFLPTDVLDRYTTIAQYDRDESAMGRLAVWRAGLQMFLDHFFTGTGAGTFSTVYGQLYIDRATAGATWRAAHNSCVQVAVELGVVGLITWLCIVYSAIASIGSTRRQVALMDEADYAPPDVHSVRLWADALLGSLVGFLIGAMFLSRAYDLLFLLLLAMIAVVARSAAALGGDTMSLNSHR